VKGSLSKSTATMFTLPTVKEVSIFRTGSATYHYVGHSLFYVMTVELHKEKVRAGCQRVSHVAYLLYHLTTIYIYIYI